MDKRFEIRSAMANVFSTLIEVSSTMAVNDHVYVKLLLGLQPLTNVYHVIYSELIEYKDIYSELIELTDDA